MESTNTTGNKVQLLQQYHQTLLPEFIKNTRQNINIRLDAIEQIVNLSLPDQFEKCHINDNIRNKIMVKIESVIKHKTKLAHKCGSVMKHLNSMNEYKKIARYRVNRNKPKFMGNLVFAEIVFNNLYPHIYQQCTFHQIQTNMIIKYFISIFIAILENYAQFPCTKPQPIILRNTLVTRNLFKSGCTHLMQIYQISADKYDTAKILDRVPTRRNTTRDAFRKVVDAIKLINSEERYQSIQVPDPKIMHVCDPSLTPLLVFGYVRITEKQLNLCYAIPYGIVKFMLKYCQTHKC